jgi:hypothetical protein
MPESIDSHHDPERFDEETLFALRMQAERKFIHLILKENSLGRSLRILEEVWTRRNSANVPACALRQFHKNIGKIISHLDQLPPPGQ